MTEYFNKKIEIIYDIFSRLENYNIYFSGWILTFLSIVFIREILEIFASGTRNFSIEHISFIFIHGPLCYIFTFLAFIILNHFLTKERITKITRVSLFMTPLILIPPIIDLIVFKGNYIHFEYQELPVFGFWEILKNFPPFMLYGPYGFLNFWGHIFCLGNNCEIFQEFNQSTYGSRVEMIIIIFLFVSYVFLKTKSIAKSMLAIAGAYFIVYLITYFPSFFSWWDINKSKSFFSSQATIYFYFIFTILLAAYWYYLYDRKKFVGILKNIRLPRLGLYLSALLFGVYLNKHTFFLTPWEWLNIFSAALAVTFSWLVAVGSNDLVDEEADKISNSSRPLPAGIMTRQEIKSLNLLFRIVSYALAFAVNFGFFMTILVRSAIAYLYSNPPFRLKIIPLVSTLCIAAGTLLGLLGGFILLHDKTIFDFPSRLTWLILAVFTLSINVIHIKDYAGDKKDKVWTIPVIFGLRNGKIIVGIMSAVSFIIPAIIYHEYFNLLIVPSICCGILAYYLINRQVFNERLILFLYYVYTIPLLFLIIG
jgi:4-hydroxybenzoate polyprenyltransferase